jgi:type IV pilus assembly protein PilM
VFESIASLDIGSTEVRLALAKKGFKTFNITEVVSERIDFAAPSYAEGVTAALKRLIDRQPIGGHRVIVMLPMDQTIVRTLTFPFTEADQIEAAVPFEAQENLPFEIEELSLSFQITSTPDEDQGRVIAAAVRKDTVEKFCGILADAGAKPTFIGLESNALFECYSNFAAVEGEGVIQVHIGHSKTIVNIIIDGRLINTRCIPSGTSEIVKKIAASTSSYNEALTLFQKIKPSLNGFDNQTDMTKLKNSGLTKPKLKTIFENISDSMTSLCSQINLTIKSHIAERGATNFDRIVISGGGAHISGLAALIHKETGIKTDRIECEPAVGAAISYFNAAKYVVHFPCAPNESVSSFAGIKEYRLAIFFGGAALLVLLINLIIGMGFSIRERGNYDAILEQIYRKTFQNSSPKGDPLADAETRVADEKKELSAITSIIPADEPLIGALSDITASFSNDPSFSIRDMIIDRENVRIEGDVSSGSFLDSFKNKLQDSKKFDKVDLSTNTTRKDLVSFTLTLRKKKPGKASGEFK